MNKPEWKRDHKTQSWKGSVDGKALFEVISLNSSTSFYLLYADKRIGPFRHCKAAKVQANLILSGCKQFPDPISSSAVRTRGQPPASLAQKRPEIVSGDPPE